MLVYDQRIDIQLGDAVADVAQCAVVAGLRRVGEVDLGVPAPHQLLDAGHVHDAVVQVGVDLGQVPLEK